MPPLALLLLLVIAGKYLNLSVGTWLLSISDKYYARYGYVAVFVGALLEGTLVLNLYVPGSTIVILGAVASRSGALNIALVIGIATSGFVLAYTFCYLLGWFGWHAGLGRFGLAGPLAQGRERLLARGLRALWLANIHPNLGALAATSAGIVHIPFPTFLVVSGLSALIWSTVWGLTAFWLGRDAVRLFNSWLLVPILLVLLGLCLMAGRRGAANPRDSGKESH